MLSYYVSYTKIATNHIWEANDNICLSCGFVVVVVFNFMPWDMMPNQISFLLLISQQQLFNA